MKMSRSLKAATLDLNMMASATAPCAYGPPSPTPVSHAVRHGSSGVKPKVQAGPSEVKFNAAFVFRPLSVLSWRLDPTPGRSTITEISKAFEFGFRANTAEFEKLGRVEDSP
jgi:hypothetical protein